MSEYNLEARWVNLGEREPNHDDEVFARKTAEDFLTVIYFAEEGDIKYSINGESYIFEDQMDQWEWLELRQKEDVEEPVAPVTDGRKKLLHDLKERMIEIEEMRRSEWNTNIKNFFKHDEMDDSEPAVPLPDGIHEVTLLDGQSAFISDSGGYYGPAFPLPDGCKFEVSHCIQRIELPDGRAFYGFEENNSEPVVPLSDGRTLGVNEFHDLADMFDLQAELNENLDASMIAVADEGNERNIAQWTQNIATAMHQELAELVDCVPWKWWANYQDYDRQNARVEIVDLFHFLISMAQLHGMTAQDVFEAYKAKCEINHKRHESGYTEKDPDDCKCI